MTPQQFNEWRINHYQERLQATTDIKCIKYLTDSLKAFKGNKTTLLIGQG